MTSFLSGGMAAGIAVLLFGCSTTSDRAVPITVPARTQDGRFSLPSTNLLQPTIIVDFSKPLRVRSEAGFLHGYITANAVPISLLTPLQPALWRFGFSNEQQDYRTVHALFPAARIVDVLSDDYGYPFTGGWNFNGNPNPPYDRAPYAGKGIPAWEGTVESIVRAYGTRPEVMYEEWNEPNNNSQYSFFYGTEAQADETQAIGYFSAVAVQPAAMVGGPATAGYDKPFIVEYLNFCVAHGCQVNFVSLHEFSDENIPSIASDLRDLRKTVDSPQYAPLHISNIFVDEAIGSDADYRPGDILGYMYYLEAGGADGAAKACWNSPKNEIECNDGSVDGIIDPSTREPRAAWWAYKAYAAGVSERVASQTADERIVALASSTLPSAAQPAAQIVLGAFDDDGPPSTATPAIEVRHLSALGFLGARTSVGVESSTIPVTGSSPLPTLPKPVDQTVPVVDDAAVFSISLPDHAGAIVTLTAPGMASSK